jgi:hypothetical protein
MTRAAPGLYPHQWSWDAAFNAMGWARLDVPTAAAELDTLFAAQWDNGMVPHIVFDPGGADYFPGPDVWACASVAPAAPAAVATSGICQPPVHALAAAAVYAAGRTDPAHRAHARTWLEGLYPKLVAWHRYLVRERRDEQTGLLAIIHGWESGTDNSQRWDAPYSRVPRADMAGRSRRDLAHVTEAGQRPSDRDYARYLALLEQARDAGYDAARIRATGSFVVGDVLFTAIFAAAGDALAHLSETLGAGHSDELRAAARDAREAVLGRVDPATGLAGDVDLRTGGALRTETIAGFAPLVAGDAPVRLRQRQMALLTGPRWAGHPGLRWRLPPSTSPESRAFDPRNYWRGPVWPVISWLLSWSLTRDGETSTAETFRRESLAQLADGSFAEYYEPFTGEPLGSYDQSWTAAVALEWLAPRSAGGDE